MRKIISDKRWDDDIRAMEEARCAPCPSGFTSRPGSWTADSCFLVPSSNSMANPGNASSQSVESRPTLVRPDLVAKTNVQFWVFAAGGIIIAFLTAVFLWHLKFAKLPDFLRSLDLFSTKHRIFIENHIVPQLVRQTAFGKSGTAA